LYNKQEKAGPSNALKQKTQAKKTKQNARKQGVERYSPKGGVSSVVMLARRARFSKRAFQL
jgi:hypothetical protein